MKVFLSHSMSGIDIDKIKEIRKNAEDKIRSFYDGEEIEIIDNYNHDNIPESAGVLWHLGASIQQLETADAIYFCNPDANTRGCKVETLISVLYDLRVLNDEIDKEIKKEDEWL